MEPAVYITSIVVAIALIVYFTALSNEKIDKKIGMRKNIRLKDRGRESDKGVMEMLSEMNEKLNELAIAYRPDSIYSMVDPLEISLYLAKRMITYSHEEPSICDNSIKAPTPFSTPTLAQLLEYIRELQKRYIVGFRFRDNYVYITPTRKLQ